MKKKKQKRRRKIIRVTIGDELLDWIFDRVCDVLEYEDMQIVVQELDEDTAGIFWQPWTCEHESDDYCIHISKDLSEKEKHKAFFHEALHIFCENTREEEICKGEKLLWSRMSEEQKQIIAYYFRKLRLKD